MLQYKLEDGSVFYLNHLISFLILASMFTLACRLLGTKKADKSIHFFVCSALTFIFLQIFALVHISWWLAPIIVLLIGIGKEFADFFNPKKKLFDWLDLVADLAGIITICFIYVFSFIMYKDM